MKVVIDFYRTRGSDDAHALVGRETVEVADLAEARETARQLAISLSMPQRPDAVSITDEAGSVLHIGAVLEHDNEP